MPYVADSRVLDDYRNNRFAWRRFCLFCDKIPRKKEEENLTVEPKIHKKLASVASAFFLY